MHRAAHQPKVELLPRPVAPGRRAFWKRMLMSEQQGNGEANLLKFLVQNDLLAADLARQAQEACSGEDDLSPIEWLARKSPSRTQSSGRFAASRRWRSQREAGTHVCQVLRVVDPEGNESKCPSCRSVVEETFLVCPACAAPLHVLRQGLAEGMVALPAL